MVYFYINKKQYFDNEQEIEQDIQEDTMKYFSDDTIDFLKSVYNEKDDTTIPVWTQTVLKNIAERAIGNPYIFKQLKMDEEYYCTLSCTNYTNHRIETTIETEIQYMEEYMKELGSVYNKIAKHNITLTKDDKLQQVHMYDMKQGKGQYSIVLYYKLNL